MARRTKRLWALEVNGLPRKIVIDRSGANTAGINTANRMLKSFGCPVPIEMVRIEYLNNTVEQDLAKAKIQTTNEGDDL